MLMRPRVEEFLAQYGEGLRDMRIRAGLSQYQLATALGISQAIISHIETGKMLPTIETEDAMINIFMQRRQQLDEH